MPAEEEYGIRILKDGTWMHRGRPILRRNLVKLLSGALTRDLKGEYWLITPYERGRIEVEDAPFTAVEMQVSGTGESQLISLRLNTDEWIDLGQERPLRFDSTSGAPYAVARPGLEAKISRAVYYDIVSLAAQGPPGVGGIGVWSGGVFFKIGEI